MLTVEKIINNPVKWLAVRTGDLKLTDAQKRHYERMVQLINSPSKITPIQSPRNKYLSEIMDKKGDY